MAFVLEDIKPEDHRLIIDNAKNLEAWKDTLQTLSRFGNFPSTWAVDKEAKAYLAAVTLVSTRDSLDRHYIYFDGDNTYVIVCDQGAGHDFHFDKDFTPSKSAVMKAINGIRSAFSVYGRYGSGPLSRRGKPSYAVNPKFEEEK